MGCKCRYLGLVALKSFVSQCQYYQVSSACYTAEFMGVVLFKHYTVVVQNGFYTVAQYRVDSQLASGGHLTAELLLYTRSSSSSFYYPHLSLHAP